MPYTIKDMSDLTGLPASTLRYYDKQGLLPNLRRDSNNTRIFTDEDFRTLKLIECLKMSGLSIKDIRDFMRMIDDDATLAQRLELFTRRRQQLRDDLQKLQEVLGVIDYKCWYYEQACKCGTEETVKNLPFSDMPEEFRKAREYLYKTIPQLDRIHNGL